MSRPPLYASTTLFTCFDDKDGRSGESPALDVAETDTAERDGRRVPGPAHRTLLAADVARALRRCKRHATDIDRVDVNSNDDDDDDEEEEEEEEGEALPPPAAQCILILISSLSLPLSPSLSLPLTFSFFQWLNKNSQY